MKGFLQRIASQALRSPASPAVHPIVGSYSSGPRHDTFPEFLAEEVVNPADTQRDAAPAKSEPSWAPPAWERRETTGQDPVQDPARKRIDGARAERAVFQPLLGRTMPEMPAGRMDQTAANPSQEELRKRLQNIPQAEFSAALPVEQLVFPDDSAPHSGDRKSSEFVLRRETVPGDAPKPEVPPREVRNPYAAEVRRAAQQPPQSSIGQPVEPDEIHINIGRIEVTATAQPPSRPAVPQRKSLNLDEYLKRRTGKNG
jgi:hypothetical protein